MSSFGCTAETADIQFVWTRRRTIGKRNNMGSHFIQAFEPGEVSPEEAYEIGMQLAREILAGKYKFVLTIHIDKEHVHNHLICHAVSFQGHCRHHSNKRNYRELCSVSVRICKEHGLPVISPAKKVKAISRIKYLIRWR